jgi:hypothetical protein
MKTELARNSDSSVDNNSIVPTRRRFVPSPSLSLPQPVKSEEAVTATNIRRRVVKKEEEGEEEVYNSHDDDDDNNNMNGTENCNSNHVRVQAVKKEEEGNDDDENNQLSALESSDDKNYDDWKNGNWCWLLSANANSNDNINHPVVKSEDDDANNEASSSSVTTTATTVAAISTARNPRRIRGARRSMPSGNEDGGGGGGGGGVANRNTDDDDDDDDENKAPKKKMRHCRPINDIGKEDEEDDTTTNGNNNDSIINSNNEGGDEEGYESWTKGNWCWVLPFPPAVDEIQTGPTAGRDKCNDDYNADNDGGVVASAKSKTRKSAIRYTTLQNERWDEMFKSLVAYKKEHKSSNVPRRYEKDPKLGKWISHQREFYADNNSKISVERIRRLDSIGFVWKIGKEVVPWVEMYQRLVAYKKQHKSTNVPWKYEKDPRLGNWVYKQRASYTKKELSIDRINRLESISFVWDPHDTKWMEMYNKLVEYKKQNKSTLVPQRYTEDPPLGPWVNTQRLVYNKGNLSGKRQKLLNSINFVYSVKKTS